MSLSPTRAPPKTIPKMQIYCILLVVTGSLAASETPKIKRIINFLNAKNAAIGIIVRQYDDKILLVHINAEYDNTLTNRSQLTFLLSIL